MTIAAGFRCVDGIMLCADTQETVGFLKRKHPKLDVRGATAYPFTLSTEPHDEHEQRNDPCAVFAGAGNDGDFLDALVDKLWRAMNGKGSEGLDAMIEAAEDELIVQYQRFVKVMPDGVPKTLLLVGVWAGPGDFELVKINGPVLKRGIILDAVGCGEDLVTYVTSRLLYMKSWLTQAIPVGIYMIDQAKEHVDGCGGDTQLVAIRELGRVEAYTSEDVKAETSRLRELDALARRIVGLSMGIHSTEVEYNALIEQYLVRLRELAVFKLPGSGT
ncbi:MAG: hypothetical protein ABSD98_14145 [Candidatus Korobacteraceae bacterium]|jgi:hypothetical protein